MPSGLWATLLVAVVAGSGGCAPRSGPDAAVQSVAVPDEQVEVPNLADVPFTLRDQTGAEFG